VRVSYIEGVDRNQQTLFPAVLDDYIAADNPVRFIDAFVASLDLGELKFERAEAAETGRPGYDPGDLVRLYLYGYLNKVRSSRKLERETQRNVEAMWLLGRLTPDFKTIADFRKDNGAAIRRACREFTVLCKKLELFSGELVAIDGSKFRAVNNRSRNFNQEGLRKTIEEIDARVDEYLGRLDHEDAAEGVDSSPSAEVLKKKIESLRERREEARILLGYMEQEQIAEVSLTDPDSRRMKTGGVTDVCYNVQAAVDEKHHLIVADDVTNDATDREWLLPMAAEAKRILERDELVVTADKGYSSNDQVKECVDRNIIPYIPKPSTSANKKLGLFTKDDFRYDSENDLYVCPAGEKLTFRFEGVEKGRPIRYYTTAACKGCELRARCTRNKRTRRITRHAEEAVLEKMYERVAARPDIIAKRKSIVEHVFGTMKRWMDQGFFLMKGLVKVRTEFSLTAFAHNLRRVLNLVSVGEMIAALP
jgi:transposase